MNSNNLSWLRKYWFITLLELIALVIVAAGLYTYFVLKSSAGKDADFEVKAGQGTKEIAISLKQENLIKSTWVFVGYIKSKGWIIQEGDYKITQDMKMTDIATLIHGGRVQQITVTIPEGYRVTQIDEALVKKGLIKKGEFTSIAAKDEGYLFPDTYSFEAKNTAEDIRQEMLDNFRQKTANLKIDANTTILASIVERESRGDQDRPKVAGVYTNRLKIDMKLDADPTVQYAKGNWNPLTVADYKNVKSPYNTYLNKGLPPGPICNPGIKSIQAVLTPEKNDYFYFFHTKAGQAVFSKTFEEHQNNLAKYR